MLRVVLHVWMHAAVVTKAVGLQVWMELTVAMRRWLVNPSNTKMVGFELVNCWRRELRLCNCMLLAAMDEGQSVLKMTANGAVFVPRVTGSDAKLQDGAVEQGPAHFLISNVTDVPEATILLDRVLHLNPPSTMSSLPPSLHINILEGIKDVVGQWIDSAICAQCPYPTALHRVSPSTVLAIFGEWFVPACEHDVVEYEASRCLAIEILCKLCAVRCVNTLTPSHVTTLTRVLFHGIFVTFGRDCIDDVAASCATFCIKPGRIQCARSGIFVCD